MKTMEEILKLNKIASRILRDNVAAKIYNKVFGDILERQVVYAMIKFAELYHTEQKKKECHCGGYPDCICNIDKSEDQPKKIFKTSADYYGINSK